jgi:hypothetical protein
MAETNKFHVKLGPHEFNGEGSEEAVRERYESWLEVVKMMMASTPAPPKHDEHKVAGNESGNGNGGQPLDRATLDRIFLVDTDGQVSLRVLPTGDQRDAAGLILLLYGYRVLSNQNDVLSGRLLASAHTSGLDVGRIDKVLAPHMDLVSKGGIRAGSRWALRNTGVNRAETIIREMI